MLVLAILNSLSGITIFAQIHSTELAIIDPDLPGTETLVREMRPGIKMVYFDKSKSMISSITEALDAFAPVSALHIVSHGNAGTLFSTSGWIDAEIMQSELPEISQWKNKFTPGGDILLYGCDVAKGNTGQHFLDKLSQVTGLDVAASDNATGSAALGGDWVLEAKKGNVQTGLCFNPGISGYDYLLSNVLVYGGPDLFSYATALRTFTQAKVIAFPLISGATTLPDLTNYPIVYVIEPQRIFNATEISYLMAHLE